MSFRCHICAPPLKGGKPSQSPLPPLGASVSPSALAQKDLLRDVDFLSTVSGGGYTGSFLTQVIGYGGGWSRVARPHGPDTPEIRRLRLNAKFISARSAWQAWGMAITTLAGMVVNWMVPLAIVILLAILTQVLELGEHIPRWAPFAGLGLSLVGPWAYFGFLRWRRDALATGAGVVLSICALGTVLSLAALGGLAL